jgi:16S rRNA (cytosine1402-N4)-methyltransferase
MKVFQALRIAVNQELVCLEKLMEKLNSVLKPDGVLILMTFHSLED